MLVILVIVLLQLCFARLSAGDGLSMFDVCVCCPSSQDNYKHLSVCGNVGVATVLMFVIDMGLQVVRCLCYVVVIVFEF